MNRTLSRLALTAALLGTLPAGAPAQAVTADTSGTTVPSIRQLAWLIGRWDFVDRSLAPGDSYRETGVRECGWALDDQYIRCESRGTVGGRGRTYLFFFNWNSLDSRFEMVALHGNYGRKTFFTAKLSDQGKRLDLLQDRTTHETANSRTWGTLHFDGHDRILWETRINRRDQLPDTWPILYRDEARRVSPPS